MDNTDNNPPALTVIEGGKRSGKTASGLTHKQERFCELMSQGLSNADAYRGAYDTGTMKPGTIYNEASKLSTRPDIAARIEAIIAEKTRKNSMFTERQKEKNSDRIWRKLWSMVDAEETPPAVKANLLSLGAKAAGMLVDRVETKTETADSKSIETELLERLQALKAV
jgi:hypothetical protein